MFPTLPPLPNLSGFSMAPDVHPLLFEVGGGGGGVPIFGGGGGGGFPGSGTINIGLPGNPASGGSGGKTSTISLGGSAPAVGYNMLSSLLGIPAINWGRIAAFLLGLILIAGGIYLIKPVQESVNRTIKTGAKGAVAA
jgi:hypothetical protein